MGWVIASHVFLVIQQNRGGGSGYESLGGLPLCCKCCLWICCHWAFASSLGTTQYKISICFFFFHIVAGQYDWIVLGKVIIWVDGISTLFLITNWHTVSMHLLAVLSIHIKECCVQNKKLNYCDTEPRRLINCNKTLINILGSSSFIQGKIV